MNNYFYATKNVIFLNGKEVANAASNNQAREVAKDWNKRSSSKSSDYFDSISEESR